MKIQNFNAYSEFGFGSKSSAKRNRIFNFFSNFHNSTQPNRTSYLLDKALDTMDSNAKEALKSGLCLYHIKLKLYHISA